jgi:transcriptional regulator with XRE-family HTH domain
MPAISPLQLKLARTALGLGVRDLAKAAGVSPATVMRFESSRGGVQSGTLDRLQTTLEDGGIIFIAADSTGGPGVRMKASGP